MPPPVTRRDAAARTSASQHTLITRRDAAARNCGNAGGNVTVTARRASDERRFRGMWISSVGPMAPLTRRAMSDVLSEPSQLNCIIVVVYPYAATFRCTQSISTTYSLYFEIPT